MAFDVFSNPTPSAQNLGNTLNNIKAAVNNPIPKPIGFDATNKPIYAAGTDFSQVPYSDALTYDQNGKAIVNPLGQLNYPNATQDNAKNIVPAYQTPNNSFDEDAFVKNLAAQPSNVTYQPNTGMFNPRIAEPPKVQFDPNRDYGPSGQPFWSWNMIPYENPQYYNIYANPQQFNPFMNHATAPSMLTPMGNPNYFVQNTLDEASAPPPPPTTASQSRNPRRQYEQMLQQYRAKLLNDQQEEAATS